MYLLLTGTIDLKNPCHRVRTLEKFIHTKNTYLGGDAVGYDERRHNKCRTCASGGDGWRGDIRKENGTESGVCGDGDCFQKHNGG